MDALRGLLEELKRHGLDHGHTLGLFHLLIGREIRKGDGTIVVRGLTWRQAAALFKKARWPIDSVRELGMDPVALPPRDRQQFWYAAISMSGLESAAARLAGDRLAEVLLPLGYEVTCAKARVQLDPKSASL